MVSKGNHHATHLLFSSQVFEANEGRIVFSSEDIIALSEALAHALSQHTRRVLEAFTCSSVVYRRVV